jgi:hypothetical protein
MTVPFSLKSALCIVTSAPVNLVSVLVASFKKTAFAQSIDSQSPQITAAIAHNQIIL